MAAKTAVLLVLTMILGLSLGPLSAQADSSCFKSLLSLMPCLDYITDRSPTASPVCCPRVSTVLTTQPLCLCYILNGEVGNVLGVQIDESRALALPGVCKLTTPPISECNTLPLPPIFPGGPPTYPGSGPTVPIATPAPAPAPAPPPPSE